MTGHGITAPLILFVDDEATAVKYFQRAMDVLTPVVTAGTVEEGKRMLDEHALTLMVLVTDQRMPGELGNELLQYARLKYPHMVRILTTAYSELEHIVEAVNQGQIHRYIQKPWEMSALRMEMKQALELAAMRKAQNVDKERLELALEAAGLDLWENDLLTGEVTRKATKVFAELGYSENDVALYIDDLFKIVHPDDVPLLKTAVDHHLTGVTRQYRCEFRLRAKSGAWVWYANYGKIMDRDGNNRDKRFIGVTFNIDDRKRKEEEIELINRKLTEQNALLESMNRELESAQMRLRISEARLHTILDNSPIGIWLVGADGRYYFVNKTFCDAVGIAESAFLATPDVAAVLGAEVAAACQKSDRECLERDEPHMTHEVLTFVDGKQHLLEITKVKLHDSTDQVTGIIGVSVDITAQHEREQALAVANRSKSEFLANVSHELRTPMNSILGLSHLALKANTDPKTRDYLEKIRHSGLHLLGIIDDILDFSKIDAQKLKIESVDFDLKSVLDSLHEMFAEKAMEKGLQFDFEIDARIPNKLCGDPRRMSQVLINFASNALKFTATGNILIRAKNIEENENGTLVRFEVQDSGIGISDEDQAKLFQPFQQLDSSTTRNYGGTGLGLAISKKLVEMMDEGNIGLDSIPGLGSTFWFSVRLGNCSKHRKSRGINETDFPPNLLSTINGAHILLAEDNLFNQQVATEFLEDAGVTVCVAQNGKEAIDLLLKDQFGCVLMDIQMPLMDGFEATRLIRANPALAKIPVIAMTGNASHEDRARCIAAGMDDYISKPFKPNTLYATLAKWLSQQPQQMPLAEMSSALSLTTIWAGDPNIIDLSVLSELIGNNKVEIRKFVLKFLESARKDMLEIESALQHKDLVALSTWGHRNKSPAKMVGAIGFANLCHALETIIKNGGGVEQAQDIVSQMSPLLDRIQEQIDEVLT